MSSSSSNNSNHLSDNSSSSNISRRSVVLQTWQVKPKCNILVKGGGVQDDGVEFQLNSSDNFNKVYVEYSKLAGVNPNNLRLTWSNNYVSPNTTPFQKGFGAREVLLAYYEDFETPIPVNERASEGPSCKVFIIHDMMGSNNHEVHKMATSTKLVEIFSDWGSKRGGRSSKEVIMYLNGVPLAPKVHDTLGDTGIKDGATIYARMKDVDVEVINDK